MVIPLFHSVRIQSDMSSGREEERDGGRGGMEGSSGIMTGIHR